MPMRRKNILKALFTCMAIVISSGCGQNTSHVNNFHLSPTSTSTTDLPVISVNNAENVNLVQILSGHSRGVLDVVFSPQGDYLASSGRDLNIKLWDVQSWEEVHAFQMSSVDMADIDISSSGNLLATGEAIWDLETREELHVLERGSHYPAFVAFSPDGSRLALGLLEEQITLWDTASGQPVYTFDQLDENRTKSMEFSPDGSLLAVGDINGRVQLLDVVSGEIVFTLAYSGETDIHGLSFSPDGRYLATGGRILSVILWDVTSGEVVRAFRLTDNSIGMDFSPDGSILATAGGRNFEVRLWDVESGALLASLPHNDQLTSIVFSPDGTLFAVGCSDGNIYLWGIPANP
jgi:WD40 repeat protein